MKTLLCFGDSNTHGATPMPDLATRGRYGSDIRWPQRLQHYAGPAWHIIEEGLPGRTTLHDDPIEGAFMNGLAFLPALLKTHGPLDKILIMLGTNDLKTRFCVTATDIALSLKKIAETLSQSGCGPNGTAPEMVFICPPPIQETGCLADMFAGGQKKSVQMQKTVPELLGQSGHQTINVADLIHVSEIDGIHYAPEMHLLLAKHLAEKLHF